MKVTNALEDIGQQPELKKMVNIDAEIILTKQLDPRNLQKALLSNDRSTLEKLAGFKQDIICYIASPEKDDDIPKDGNKPSEEDNPLNEEAILNKAS